MHWFYLALSGLIEIGWITSLRFAEGFTQIVPTILYCIFGIGSAYFLSLSMRGIPTPTAYSIWMGVAVVGTAVLEKVWFGVGLGTDKLLCIGLIMLGIGGLHFSSRKKETSEQGAANK